MLTDHSLTERCNQMAGLLKGLRTLANAEDDAKILDILDTVNCIFNGSSIMLDFGH